LAKAGKLSAVFEMLLPEQFGQFTKLSVPTWKLVELLGAWQRHFGVSLGGSPASPQRSARTRRR
jgi:hypothetical protein